MGSKPRTYFGRWLHAQLRAAGWVETDLVDALGVRQTTVTYWATGVCVPRPAMVEAVAAFLAIQREAGKAGLARDEADPAEPIPIVVAP
jgi:transcriptional regulator with XRE-family HTH domain